MRLQVNRFWRLMVGSVAQGQLFVLFVCLGGLHLGRRLGLNWASTNRDFHSTVDWPSTTPHDKTRFKKSH